MKKVFQHIKVLMVLVVVLINCICPCHRVPEYNHNLTGHPEIFSRLERQDISAIPAILLSIPAIVAHRRGFVTAVTGSGYRSPWYPPAVVTGITNVLPLGSSMLSPSP
ncbi:MAG: hypothetical protein WC294_06915 [Methanoregula sp.]